MTRTTIISASDMLDCSEFLEDYSGFRDGSLDEFRRAALAAHRDGCTACARYDEVISSGVEMVRALPEIEPSYDFLPRLQHRIYHLEDERSLRERRASGASAMLIGGIALAIGATAWAPLMRSGAPVIELPPIVAHAPHKVEALQYLFRAGPLLTEPATAGTSPRSLFHEYSPLGRFASTPLRAP